MIYDYGVVADSKATSTSAIQKTVDACNKGDGGIVYVPAGIFVTGTFNLKSKDNLYLETGAMLKGSSNLTDYPISFELTDSKLNDVAGGSIDLRGRMREQEQLFQRDIPAALIQYAKNDFKLKWTDTRSK